MALPISISRRRTDIGTGWDSRIDEMAVDLAMVEKNTVKFTYDFAVNGGAVANHHLGRIPDNCVVTNMIIDVITPVVGAGATTAIDIDTDGAGVLPPTAVGATGYGDLNIAGLHSTPLGEILITNGDTPAVAGGLRQASYIKTGGDRNVDLTVTAAPLTAGRLHVYVTFFVSE